VKDEIASREKLVDLFERVHFFLQRLNRYIGIPLSPDMIESLGKIMAQVLSILALSTKMMNERRTSWSTPLIYSPSTDCGTEKVMKMLMGHSDVDDAFQRLDMLTKEENLMTAARNLELTHNVSVRVQAIQELTQLVDDKVSKIPEAIQGVDRDVKATKEVIHNVRNNMEAFQEDLRGVNDSLRLTRRSTRYCFTSFIF
jgi:hypothetical protein